MYDIVIAVIFFHWKDQRPGTRSLIVIKILLGVGYNPNINNRLESDHKNLQNPIMVRLPVT